MPNKLMQWDTPAYIEELRKFKRVMGIQTFRQAEEALYPIKARKRQLKIQERIELETTIKRNTKGEHKMSPRTAESNALANIMGVNDPITFDQKELDDSIAKVVKQAGELAATNNARRDEKNGLNKPEAIDNRRKIELFRLREIAKNAAVRLNSYGMPDCRLAQERIDAALAARKVAAENGSLNEERRQELLLQQHEAELVKAQERLEKFRLANTRAVVALQNWEHTNSLVHAEASKTEKA